MKQRFTLVLTIIGLLLIYGCFVEPPWFYRADKKQIYKSRYFKVKPPTGRGWSAREFSSVVQFKYENLFNDLPNKICFTKYTTAQLYPHPEPHRWCDFFFYSVITEPEKFNHNAKLMVEEEFKKNHGKLPVVVNEIIIGKTKYLELANITESKVRNFMYIHFLNDLNIMNVIDVNPYIDRNITYSGKIWENLPGDIREIIRGYEIIEGMLSGTELMMQRATQIIYKFTLHKKSWEPDVPILLKRCEQYLQSVIDKDPDNYKAHLFLGVLHLLEKRANVYGFGLELSDKTNFNQFWVGPWDIAGRNVDGEVLNSLLVGDIKVEKAQSEFQKALEVKPDSFLVNYYLAFLYLRQKNYDKAIMQSQRLIDYFPESSLAFYLKGVVYKESSNIDKALETFRVALEKNKKDGYFVERYDGPIKEQIRTLERFRK
jgi:tetratricopeptide (TPR) repeat protein